MSGSCLFPRQKADARAAQMAREARSSVNIRELFSGAAAKEFRKELERQERERWEKMNKDNKYLNRYCTGGNGSDIHLG